MGEVTGVGDGADGTFGRGGWSARVAVVSPPLRARGTSSRVTASRVSPPVESKSRLYRRMSSPTFDLSTHPVHLGLGASMTPQETFTGDMAWYERYGARVANDGAEGRLVAMHTFTEPWSTWEMHPQGHELVVCTAGRLTLHQRIDGEVVTVVLEPGQAVINPPGVWHTADVDATATALFITAGMGTEIEPR